MKHTYSYDDLYGTLLYKNEDDTERTYFIIECLKFKFIWWYFRYGWNKKNEKKCDRNGLVGFEITLHK